jgi:hypothetical protein
MTFFLRWAVTFLAFPLGGFLALPLTPITTPWTAALAGVITGASLGLLQWWALRSGVRRHGQGAHTVDWRWAAATTLGMVLGSALATAVTSASTSLLAIAVHGLIAGAAVGSAQGALLRRGPGIAVLWAAIVSVSWALGWIVTANVVNDIADGFAIFGASGAAVVTAITGVALRLILGREDARAGRQTPVAAPVAGAVR